MQYDGVIQETEITPHQWVVPHEVPLLARFLGKLVLDILPAALASVIGGFLFTQYQFGHTAVSRPAAELAAPASAEMMQLVRDEHTAIMDYLKTQMAAEKSRLAAADEDAAQPAEDATVAAPAAAVPARRVAVTAAAAVASKSAAARSKAPVVASVTIPAHAPLVIAQAEPDDGAAPVAAAPRQPDSLLARTLDVKDHVVDATLHVVSAIGSIPSWIASMGDRIGGAGANSGAGARQFSTPS
jgi:hypothetical protein